MTLSNSHSPQFPPLPDGAGASSTNDGRPVRSPATQTTQTTQTTSTQPLDISALDTATLALPAVQSDMYYWLGLWSVEHEQQALVDDAAARDLATDVWGLEGSLGADYEAEETLASYSCPSMDERRRLKATRERIARDQARLSSARAELLAHRSHAREHRQAAAQLRAVVEKEARRLAAEHWDEERAYWARYPLPLQTSQRSGGGQS